MKLHVLVYPSICGLFLMSPSIGAAEEEAKTPEAIAPQSQDETLPPSEEAIRNPYSDPSLSWATGSGHSSIEKAALPKKAPSEKTKEKDPSPFEEVEDTEHVVPTSFNNQGGPMEKDLRPFSVGGIMAQLGDETWFKFYGFFQIRYVTADYETVDDGRISGGGFNLARARVFFRGHLTNWLSTLLRVGARSDGSVNVEQAYADFHFNDFTLRVGQWYLPVFQEQFLSPVAQLTLNSTAVGSFFDGGQTQGARLLWDLDATRMQVSLSDGLRSGFSEIGSSKVADIAVTYRVEHSLGEEGFLPFTTGSSFRGEEWSSLFGLGAHYQSGGELREDAVELGSINGDVTLEGHGMNLHFSTSVSVTGDGADSQLTVAGFVGQGGYFVHDWTELYARYEALLSEFPSESDSISLSSFRGITAGINHYFWPARGLRLQGDFIYYFDPTVGTPIAINPNAGLFESIGPQWTLRTQLNMLF